MGVGRASDHLFAATTQVIQKRRTLATSDLEASHVALVSLATRPHDATASRANFLLAQILELIVTDLLMMLICVLVVAEMTKLRSVDRWILRLSCILMRSGLVYWIVRVEHSFGAAEGKTREFFWPKVSRSAQKIGLGNSVALRHLGWGRRFDAPPNRVTVTSECGVQQHPFFHSGQHGLISRQIQHHTRCVQGAHVQNARKVSSHHRTLDNWRVPADEQRQPHMCHRS